MAALSLLVSLAVDLFQPQAKFETAKAELSRFWWIRVPQFTLFCLLHPEMIIQKVYWLVENLDQSNDLGMDLEILVPHLIDIYSK